MKPLHTMFLSCFLTLALIFGWNALIEEPLRTDTTAELPQEEPPPIEEIEPEPEPEWKHYTVSKGDVLGSILPKFGLSTNEIRNAALSIHDLANLRIGQELQFQFMPNATIPNEIHMSLGEDDTLVIQQTDDGWIANKESVIYETKMGYREFVVESSLWNAAIQGGLRARDIAQMAHVLQYDIDFNTEIRKGAKAQLLVEEFYQDGEFVKLGAALVLRFINQDKEYLAIRYTDSKDITAYYDDKGISRESPFLRSPLAFSRVTSNFNPKRFHPILKKKRPHNGTDFGAKTGTPVRSVSDGVVTYAGRNGGHGNFVKIKHQNPYQTSYSHLSKISVKKGQKVKKGQVIGKVGSTGASTGPHLHYQVWKNGRFVDAMKVKFPKGKKLPSSELQKFNNNATEYLRLMEELNQ